ncbi:MAG: hypothetical protein JWP31_1783 [Aeromicrobium sp.]|nr:hypothetical protein [Aeromicrobium sp.]
MTSSASDLPAAERARRRRAAELLGDLLPESTTDDTDEGWGERRAPTRDDDYLRDVPPHHG